MFIFKKTDKKLMDKKVLHTDPESQDSWGWKGNLEMIYSNSVEKAGASRTGHLELLSVRFRSLQNGDFMTCLRNLFQGLISITIKRFFSYSVQLAFSPPHNLWCLSLVQFVPDTIFIVQYQFEMKRDLWEPCH